MSFKELRDKLINADRQAIADWETRENDWVRGPPSIEERLSFVEFRRSMLAGAVGALLIELIAREESATEAPNAQAQGRGAGFIAPLPWSDGFCTGQQ